MWFIKLRLSAGISGYVWGVCECALVYMGVCGCARVSAGVGGIALVCMGVRWCAWVCTGVCGYAWICACVWDEFSEFLLKNRVPTSADFNTYPIRIFWKFLYFKKLTSNDFLFASWRTKNCKNELKKWHSDMSCEVKKAILRPSLRLAEWFYPKNVMRASKGHHSHNKGSKRHVFDSRSWGFLRFLGFWKLAWGKFFQM